MLTEDEKKQIETAAESGTLLPDDLKSKYISQLQDGPAPYPGMSVFECCRLPTGGGPISVKSGHCAILGGNVIDDYYCTGKKPGSNSL